MIDLKQAMQFGILFLCISAGLQAQTNVPPAPVYVVNYDHLGVIFWGEQSIDWNLDVEFERLEKYDDFTVGWDHEAYAYDFMSKNMPDLLKRMQEGIKKYPDRLSIGTSTYGQPLSRFINEESNIRQLTMARSTIREYFNQVPTCYIMGEHAFHAQMPQLLKNAGFESSIMRTHFMMYGYNPTINEPVVNWKGVDGSLIPTVPTYEDEDFYAVAGAPYPFGAVTDDGAVLTDFIRRGDDSLDDFRKNFGDSIRPLVASRADDPRQPYEILEYHAGDPNIHWTTAEDLFEFLPDPHVIFAPGPDDFVARMPWGYCGNQIWNDSREAEANVLTAERLAAIQYPIGKKNLESALTSAWKNLLVAQHHDIQIVGLEKGADAFLGAAMQQSNAVIDQAFDVVAPRIGANSDNRLVVYNPLNWERQELIQSETGEQYLAQLPALGFTALYESEKSGPTSEITWDEKTHRLRTPFYTITLSPNGGWLSMTDNRDNRNILVNGRKSGVLTAFINGKRETSTGTYSFMKGAYSALLEEEGFIGTIPYEAKWTFYDHSKRIDLKLEIDVEDEIIGKPLEEGVREAHAYPAFEHDYKLNLNFFPNLYGELTGYEDHPFVINQTDAGVLQGIYWNAAHDGRNGLAIFNRGTMATLVNRDNSISIPLAFSGDYIWNTVRMHGKYDYEMAFLPFTGNWKENDLHRKALEYNFPLVVKRTTEWDKDNFGDTWTPYQANDEGAILSALYVNEGDVYARFYEYTGENASVSVKWFDEQVDFSEVDFENHFVSNPGAKQILKPWQISTLKFNKTVVEKSYDTSEIPEKVDFIYKHDWINSKWLKPETITEEDLQKIIID